MKRETSGTNPRHGLRFNVGFVLFWAAYAVFLASLAYQAFGWLRKAGLL